MAITGSPSVRLKAEPVGDFLKHFQSLTKDANNRTVVKPTVSAENKGKGTHMMANIPIPLFNGQTFDNPDNPSDPGRGSNTANLVVNFSKMANLSEELLVQAMGMSQADAAQAIGLQGPDGYTGFTEAETPVSVSVTRNLSEQDPLKRVKIGLEVDMKALAGANDIERAKNSGDRKIDERSNGRLPLTCAFTTTYDGVAGMTADRMVANTGLAASQAYLLTASKKDPDKTLPGKDTVEAIGKLFASEYTSFMKTAIEKGCDGIPRQVKDAKSGKYVSSKTETVPKTGFKPLGEMGVTMTEVNGATVIAIDPSKASRPYSSAEMVNFNNAFNAHMSQVVNRQFGDKDPVARNLANQMGINSYAVKPRVPGTNEPAGVTLIQPSTTLTVKPFAESVTTSVMCATHQNTKPIEQLYSPKILENAAAIANYFPVEKTDLERARGQMEAVSKAVGVELQANGPEITE